jgi:hypothetical protein
MAEKTRSVSGQLDRGDLAEDELLGSDPQPIAVGKRLHRANETAIDSGTVATAEIGKRGLRALDAHLGVMTGHEWVDESNPAVGAPTDERIAWGKIEFLQREPEAVAGQGLSVRRRYR